MGKQLYIFMKNILKTIYQLLIPIITIVVGTFLASWLFYQYNSPQIKYYFDEHYQQIGDYSIGEIYIVNEGRKVDENISVVLNENISPNDISVAYVSSPIHVKNENNRTFISIAELKPGEGAEIVFKLQSQNVTFSLDNITSRSGNVRAEEWINPWWHLSRLQFGVLILLIIMGFGVGFVIGLWKNDLLARNN